MTRMITGPAVRFVATAGPIPMDFLLPYITALASAPLPPPRRCPVPASSPAASSAPCWERRPSGTSSGAVRPFAVRGGSGPIRCGRAAPLRGCGGRASRTGTRADRRRTVPGGGIGPPRDHPPALRSLRRADAPACSRRQRDGAGALVCAPPPRCLYRRALPLRGNRVRDLVDRPDNARPRSDRPRPETTRSSARAAPLPPRWLRGEAILHRPFRSIPGPTAHGLCRSLRAKSGGSADIRVRAAGGPCLPAPRRSSRPMALALLSTFGQAVLGVPPEPCLHRLDLDRLLAGFEPPLPEDVRSVRVTALELCYPASEGRRRITLQTNATDRPTSITTLLDRHVRREEIERSRLSVTRAELQVELRERGRRASTGCGFGAITWVCALVARRPTFRLSPPVGTAPWPTRLSSSSACSMPGNRRSSISATSRDPTRRFCAPRNRCGGWRPNPR